MWNLIDQILGFLNQARLTERDKDCIRLLLALEIDLNFFRFALFFQSLCAGLRLRDAQQVRSTVGAAPQWERVRWDSAPILLARTMTGDQLSRVGRFYVRLARTTETYDRLLPEGTQATECSDPGQNAHIFDQLNYSLSDMLTFLDGGPPFTHLAITPTPLPIPHYRFDDRWLRMTPASLLALTRAERFGTPQAVQALLATLSTTEPPGSSDATSTPTSATT